MRHIFAISVLHSEIQYRQFGCGSGWWASPEVIPLKFIGILNELATSCKKTQILSKDRCPGGPRKGKVTDIRVPAAKRSALSKHGRPVVEASNFYGSSWEPLVAVYVSNHWPFRPDSDSWPQSSAAPSINSLYTSLWGWAWYGKSFKCV